MAPLLQPAECTLVLVDPRTQHLSHAGGKAQHLPRRFHDVQVAARAAAVPVHLALADPAPDPQDLLAMPGQPPDGIHSIGQGGLSWLKSGLAELLVVHARPCLVLCGFWLETTVTFLALPALAHGFDVVVLMDIALARSDEAREAARARLLQAGAVPATTRQLIAEWAEQTPDPHASASLASLIAIE